MFWSFALFLVGLNDPIVWNGIDCHRLPGESKEEFCPAFRPPPIEPDGKPVQIVAIALRREDHTVDARQPLGGWLRVSFNWV